jgi:hypothetical protein
MNNWFLSGPGISVIIQVEENNNLVSESWLKAYVEDLIDLTVSYNRPNHDSDDYTLAKLD